MTTQPQVTFSSEWLTSKILTHFPLAHRSHNQQPRPLPLMSQARASLGTPDKASPDLCPDILAVFRWQNVQRGNLYTLRET